MDNKQYNPQVSAGPYVLGTGKFGVYIEYLADEEGNGGFFGQPTGGCPVITGFETEEEATEWIDNMSDGVAEGMVKAIIPGRRISIWAGEIVPLTRPKVFGEERDGALQGTRPFGTL